MKKKFFNLVLIAFTIVACALLAFPSIIYQADRVNADYVYTILDSGMFTETITISQTNYSINCYRIQNHDTYIAVAWGQSAESAPTKITIPEKITSDKPTGEDVEYTVVALARGAFARSKAATIVLPQTVVDIREEALLIAKT